MDLLKKETYNYDATVVWIPNCKCNLNCVYCIVKDSKNLGNINKINIPALNKTLNDTNRTINLEFTGGEPFLIPNIIEASIEITKNHFISFETNLTSKKIKEFSENISPERVERIFSALHIKELERLNLLDRFINNFHICKERGFNISVCVVAYPSIIKEAKEYKKVFQERGIQIDYKPFIGEFNGKHYPISYTERELKILNFNSTNKLLYGKFNKGKLCNAGYNVCVVNPKGESVICFYISKMIGNIYDKIKFTDGLIQCPLKFCQCPINTRDIYLFKKAIEETNLKIIRSMFLKPYVLKLYLIHKIQFHLSSKIKNKIITYYSKIRKINLRIF